MIAYKLIEDVYLYHSYDDEKYMIDLDKNDSYQLNNTSYYICSIIENDWFSIDQICDILYDAVNGSIDRMELYNDINGFLQELVQQNFVSIKEENK